MHQCGLINYNKCSTLAGDADNGGGHVCGVGCIWAISVPSAQFCCEPKSALKKKNSLLKKHGINAKLRNGEKPSEVQKGLPLGWPECQGSFLKEWT